MDWYDTNIEDPLKEIVKALRNNGINTFCSCGHKLYIEAETYDVRADVDTVYNILVEMGIKEYRINVFVVYSEKYFYNTHLEIMFPDENGQYHKIFVDNEKFERTSLTNKK